MASYTRAVIPVALFLLTGFTCLIILVNAASIIIPACES
jgi:hypothetical protein